MARFTVKGKQYELATIDSLSFDEAIELKRISKMTGNTLIRGLADTDPEAWLGVFVVSMQRVDGTANEGLLAGENLIDLVNSVEGEEGTPTQGAQAPEPQEEPAEAVESKLKNDGDGKTETSPSAGTASPTEGEEENSSSESTTLVTPGGLSS